MNRMQRVLTAIGSGFLLFLMLGAWSLSSPVGSAPDDDFHLASIWCGQGERDGLCEAGSDEASRLVPAKAVAAVCYAFKPQTTAACQGSEYLDEGFALTETTRVNSGNQYPGGFYFVTSFLAGENIAASTVLIRLFNSALFSALVVATWCILPRRLRFTLAGSTALTMVPMGLFFTASANPSSWAILSGVLLIPSLLGWFMAEGGRRWMLGGVAVLAAVLAYGSRGDSAAYVAVGAVAATVLAFRNTRAFWIRALLPALLVLGGALVFLGSGQTGLALSGDMGQSGEGENPTSKAALAVINLLSLPSLWNGVFAQGWGLGWLDTDVPALAPAVMVFLYSGVLFMALRRMNWRRAITLVGVGAAVTVVPLYILVQSYAIVGQEVQPRYILPLITMFIAAAIAPNAQGDAHHWLPNLTLSSFQLWTVALGVAGAQALALLANLRRNVTGGSYNLDGAAEWWWATGPSPFTVLAIGTIAGFALLAVFAIASGRAVREDEPEPSPSTTSPVAA